MTTRYAYQRRAHVRTTRKDFHLTWTARHAPLFVRVAGSSSEDYSVTLVDSAGRRWATIDRQSFHDIYRRRTA